ncbi:MAG: 6-phosphofructokinase [Pseudomonadota bacterium]|nr:6-phosphofructokinase [Pseudomonadota bacterium]
MNSNKIIRHKVVRHKRKIKTIGVLTSGGDAPGMNAAIRAVVRAGIYYGCRVIGIYKGYAGLLEGHFEEFNLSSVANIIQRGGTIIKSSRCPEFHKKSYRKQAHQNLVSHGIDALVAIGGDGTFRGAHLLWTETGFPVAGVPGTIDNDCWGTDITIGFDSAINTGLRAIDQIRDTAGSHDRLFIVEVMGRNSGYIAMDVGIGGGADSIIIPEDPSSVKNIAAQIQRGVNRGKTSSIIVCAEGPVQGKSYAIANELKKKYGYKARVCILGHTQRGGSPTARDRKVASIMGAMAVRELLGGYSDFMTGIDGLRPQLVSLIKATEGKKTLHQDLILLGKILAT